MHYNTKHFIFRNKPLNLALALIIAAMIPLCVTGQNDSLQLDFQQYAQTRSEKISRWRRILTDQFIAGNMQEVKRIKNYLVNEFEDDTYLVFFAYELTLLDYWTGDYGQIITLVKKSQPADKTKPGKKIVPGEDQLWFVLVDKTRNSVAMLEFNVLTSGLALPDKEFLSLNLKWMMHDYTDPPLRPDSLNNLADQFLKNNPDSPYEQYVRKNIRVVYKPAKWGFAFEFFSGYGIFTNDLADYYRNNVPVGVAFDISYRRIVLYLRDYIGFSKTRTDIPYPGGTWSSGSQVRVFLPEASLGYVVAENRLIKLAPFAGIGSTDIGPTSNDTKENPDLKETELNFTTTWIAGLSIDLKLNGFRKQGQGQRRASSFGFLRLRYTFAAPQFSWHYDDRYGFMHCFTLGIGAFSRKEKRDY